MAFSHSILLNAFTEDECRSLIGLGLSKPLQVAYSPGMKVDPEYRSSMVRFIYRDEGRDWIFDRMWSLANSVDHGFDITTLEFLQFTEYKAQYSGHFGKHSDTQVFYHASNRNKRIKRLTTVIQLSDPHTYAGGELILYPKDGVTITGQNDRGCAIMFPSNTIHEATKVTLGVRYSLVAWFEGPK